MIVGIFDCTNCERGSLIVRKEAKQFGWINFADSMLQKAVELCDAGIIADLQQAIFYESCNIAFSTESSSFDWCNEIATASIETFVHSIYTAHAVMKFCNVLKMNPYDISIATVSAMLHDIGKLYIPSWILHKTSTLDDVEYQNVRRHPMLGMLLLKSWKMPERIVRVAAEHHERWDGSGYPYGLCEYEISTTARIVSLCDAINAMMMRRSYKGNLESQVIRAEVARCSGSQFDPELATTLLNNWEVIYSKSDIE